MLAFRSFQSSEGTSTAEVCVVDRTGSDEHCLTTGSQWLNGIPAWSPDGKFLAFRSKRLGSLGMDVVNVADGSLKSISLDVPMRGDPTWSPGGDWLAFQGCPSTTADQTCANIPDMEVYAASVVGQELRQLTATAGYNGQITWTGH
jgi:Tol biopolymer transport system component